MKKEMALLWGRCVIITTGYGKLWWTIGMASGGYMSAKMKISIARKSGFISALEKTNKKGKNATVVGLSCRMTSWDPLADQN